MNATNRKIDHKADPANDPAMQALRPGNRLEFLMAEIRQDNPIGKPDRPHPPVTELRTATSLDTQREELQRAISQEAPAQAAVEQPAPVVVQQVAETITLPLGTGQATEPQIELRQEAAKPSTASRTEVGFLPQQSEPEPGAQRPETLPVNDAALHALETQEKKRLRGRPRVSEEKKRESSYTLSPHVADRIRDLAAHEQLRLRRTISASAILERMIEIAEEHIQDNKVLPS